MVVFLCNVAIVLFYVCIYTLLNIYVGNNSTNDAGDDGSDGGLSTGDIIAIVFGVITSITSVVGLIFAVYLKRKGTGGNHQTSNDVGNQSQTNNGNCFYN